MAVRRIDVLTIPIPVLIGEDDQTQRLRVVHTSTEVLPDL